MWGKACRYALVRAAGGRTTLLDIPRYDFNWQLLYRLHERLALAAGAAVSAAGEKVKQVPATKYEPSASFSGCGGWRLSWLATRAVSACDLELHLGGQLDSSRRIENLDRAMTSKTVYQRIFRGGRDEQGRVACLAGLAGRIRLRAAR